MYIRRLTLVFALLITIFAAGNSFSANQNDDDKFSKLVGEYLEFQWKNSPLSATFNGIHTYDDQMESFSLAAAKEQLEENRQFVGRFKSGIDRAKLNESNQIDFDLIQNSLKAQEFSLTRSHDFEQEPSTYPNIVAGIGFLMFSREYAPFEERMGNLAKRMEKMPQLLEEGKKNLKNPPKLWTQIAIETTTGAAGLYAQVLAQAITQLPETSDARKRFEAANPKLVAALKSYQEFLEKDLLPRSNGSFADGRENFIYRLKNFYLIDQSPEEIKAVAQKVLEDTKAKMVAEAKKVDPNKNWWEILDEAKKKHGTAEELLPTYRKVTERARQWVLDKKLASIPEEKLDVIETPLFMRFVTPYAAYFSPAPFEKQQTGYYFVTPVDTSLPAEEKDGKLGEMYIDVENTTVHEAYPGHHLQLIHQNLLSPIRRMSGSSLMSEGWGLYCERLGEDYGFYSTPIDLMQAYRWVLIRAIRVLVDVGLHVDGMTYEDAVKMMLDNAKIEKTGAEGEVRRYTQSPTQPLSYLMGMLMIEQLRDDYHKAKGDSFSIDEFHDSVLSYGSIPLKIIRESMMKRVATIQ